MKLYVPYTRIAEATEAFLSTWKCVPEGVHVERVPVDQGWAYLNHLQACWNMGESFLNMEHDIVPWPGAIQSLLVCPREWCFFGYLPDFDFVSEGSSVLGLTKFTAPFIAKFPHVWQAYREECENDGRETPWRECDTHLGRYARKHGGWPPHQHFPAVLNANPNVIIPPVDPHEHAYEVSPYVPPEYMPCSYPHCRVVQGKP